VADFRASAMGIKPKSPGSVATVSKTGCFQGVRRCPFAHEAVQKRADFPGKTRCFVQ
jgi:hypothetical protein